jgi:hypothetical protein
MHGETRDAGHFQDEQDGINAPLIALQNSNQLGNMNGLLL